MDEELPDFDAFSFGFSPPNIYALQWGPGDNFAVANEHVVSIYNVQGGIHLVRTIPRHKSTITTLKWSRPTVEIMKSDSFYSFLAVGDSEGNCIVYDALSGARHAGISPISDTNVSITAIQWSLQRSSILYVLTSTHDNNSSLLCFQVGSTAHRRSSAVESCHEHGMPFQTFNMSPIWAQSLPGHFDFIAIDPINPLHLLIISSSGQYCGMQLHENSNIKSALQSGSLKTNSRIIGIEYFPFARDRLLILTTNTLTVFDLNTLSHSLIVSSSSPSTSFVPISSFFAHSDPEHFWLVSSEGLITRFYIETINQNSKRNDHTQPSSIQFENHHNFEISEISENDTGLEDVTHEKWSVLSQLIGFSNKFIAGCSDPLNPNRLLMIQSGGKILLFEGRNRKIFLKSMIPGLGDMTIDWDSYQIPKNPVQFALLLQNQSIYALINHKPYIFKINSADKTLNTIKFVEDKLYAAGSKGVYLLNLEKRRFELFQHFYNTGTKIQIYSDCIATVPFPHIFEITYPNAPKRQANFRDQISNFTRNVENLNRWAIISSTQVFVVEIDEKSVSLIRKFSFERVIGDIVDAVYFADTIFLATTSGAIVRANVDTGVIKSTTISSVSLKKMKYFSGFLFVIDSAQISYLINHVDLQPAAVCKIRIIDGRLVRNNILVQISRTMFKVVQFPTLAAVTLSTSSSKSDLSRSDSKSKLETSKSTSELQLTTESILANKGVDVQSLKTAFLQSKTLSEMEQLASVVGDLDFIQFIRTIKGDNNLPLPGTYTCPQKIFKADSRCTHVCDYGNISLKNFYMEYHILNKELHNAADCILESLSLSFNPDKNSKYPQRSASLYSNSKSAQSQDVRQNDKQMNLKNEVKMKEFKQLEKEKNLIMAMICLAPSKQAIETITKLVDITGLERLIAQLYGLAGDMKTAAQLLIETGDYNGALRFIKFGFGDDDEEGKQLICHWIRMRKSLGSQCLIFGVIGDIHACMGILERYNDFSKAMAYGKWIKENNKEVKESPLKNELELDDFEVIWNRVQDKWAQLCSMLVK